MTYDKINNALSDYGFSFRLKSTPENEGLSLWDGELSGFVRVLCISDDIPECFSDWPEYKSESGASCFVHPAVEIEP